jgi:hypothetical protein
MSAICASALVTSMPVAPANRPRALRTSMPARSNTSSPETPVRAGQTGAGVPGRAVAAAFEAVDAAMADAGGT